ncbi:MAG: DUF1847 domain-containing protein [Bacillota bacterium]
MAEGISKEKFRSVCAKCEEVSCREVGEEYPDWCLQEEGSWLEDSLVEYQKSENKKLYKTAAYVESTGYKKWPRLQEIAEYALKANFKNIGLAFCIGLKREAEIAAQYFTGRGLKVNSAVCCCGSINKSRLEIPPEDHLNPDSDFEAGCNPVGQAKMLAESGTEFNIVLGLCVGHDSLFFKYSEAPATVLAVKDRVLGHNPLAAIYNSNSYYGHLFKDKE